MDLPQFLSMAAFALAASISPGPVNIMCLSTGTRFGVKSGLWFVSGATAGFTLLFLAVALGLYNVLSALPGFGSILTGAGIAFLLYLSVVMYLDDGSLSSANRELAPGFMTGAVMQWLNPKAWVASMAGISAYSGGEDLQLSLLFTLIYIPICWCSLSSWVLAGKGLSRFVAAPKYVRLLNRLVATLLLLSCVYLLPFR